MADIVRVPAPLRLESTQLVQVTFPCTSLSPRSIMASVAIKTLTMAQALSSTETEEGFRYVRLTDTCYPDLESLKNEVNKAVGAGKIIKRAKDISEPTEKAAFLQKAGVSAYAETNVLFDYCNKTGVQGKIFEALEFDSPCDSEVDMIWSTQIRSDPADLIVRPKPNPWTDGVARAPHVDSHKDRVLTEYVVDATRLDDCWTHSQGFRSLVGKWMSVFYPDQEQDKMECLARLTQDMRRLRYHHSYTEVDSRVAPLPEAEVSEADKEPSTFWSAFSLVPKKAYSFSCNLTTETDERVAKPLAFAHPSKVTLVPERSLGREPMKVRPGAQGTQWATHTLSGPEYAVAKDAEFKCVLEQPFGFVVTFDTCVAPHVAHVQDEREGATRVSLEARKLRFAVDTSKWAVEGESWAAPLPQEADGLVVIKDCPITVVPGFIACVSLDEDPVASRAKMFSVAQKYFLEEKNRTRFGLTENMELFTPRTPYKAGSICEHEPDIGAHLTLACSAGSYAEEVTNETAAMSAGQRMDVTIQLSTIKLVQPASDQHDKAVRGVVYVTALVDKKTTEGAGQKRKALGYVSENPSPHFHVSLAVISYKNEDHEAMRKDYEVDLSSKGETCLVSRKTVASTPPQTSED